MRRISYITAVLLFILPSLVYTQRVVKAQDRTEIILPELDEAKSHYPFKLPYHNIRHPRVALVLSGGGARGIAAIGVLRALEKNNIPVDLIVGTSMGSVIGGLYSMGYSTEQLQQMIDTTNWEEMLSYTDEARRRDMFFDQKIARDKSILVLRFKGLVPVIPEAFSTGQRLTNYLNILTFQGIYKPDTSFDDLRIPFKAVTTDLVTGRRIVIDKGDMTETLRACLAVPLLFSSVSHDTLQLLDGGLVDNLPVDIAIASKADIIIAVDMVSPLRPRSKLNAPWEIADQITTIMMQEAIRLAREKASLVITPKLEGHLPSDFTDLDSLIILGESAADESIPKLKALIQENTIKLWRSDSITTYKHPRFIYTEDLSTDCRDTLQLYEKRGWVTRNELQRLVNDLYKEGSYDSAKCAVTQNKDSIIVRISLTSNPVLKAVNVSGNHVFSSDSLLWVFKPLVNKPINIKKITNGLEHLLTIYRGSGYSLASIQYARLDSANNTLNINIDEGVVSRTDIRGTIKTRDWVIRRELPWHQDELLTSSEIGRAISNLNGTNLFDQIRLTVHREKDSTWSNIIIINAHERSTELIRFGLRIDNERNIQPSIDIRDENLLGAGAEIGMFIGGGSRNQSYIAELKATRIFNTYLTFSLKGYSLVRDIYGYGSLTSSIMDNFGPDRVGEYREMRNGSTASFGAQLERFGSVIVEGRLEKQQVFNIFNNPITNQEYNISSIRFGTNVDTQDKVPYPTDGVVINFSYESALVKFIEAVGFTKLFFSYDKYISIEKDHVIHPKLIIGVADETLPMSEQFSLGGQQNFFGYHENNARGRQLFIASLEYQYKLPFTLFFDTYFKTRYDFGSVLARPEEMHLVDFRHGIGLTIGLDTPIGPAEFSLGRSFYFRQDKSNSPLEFTPFVAYFNIGFPINGVIRH